MQSTAFFEKKISLTPKDVNTLKTGTIEQLLTVKSKEQMENKCSEHGFILPGSLKLLSRSMGYFESARFTGDAVYYVKLEGTVVYPVDGVQVVGEVIRKNKVRLGGAVVSNGRSSVRVVKNAGNGVVSPTCFRLIFEEIASAEVDSNAVHEARVAQEESRSDGSAWSEIGSQNVSMAPCVLVILIVAKKPNKPRVRRVRRLEWRVVHVAATRL